GGAGAGDQDFRVAIHSTQDITPPMTDLERYLQNWQDEVDSAAQYRVLSELTKDPRLVKVFGNLARAEESHSAFWEERLRRAGGRVPTGRPSWRARVLIFLARRFGAKSILSTIAASEAANRNVYRHQPETHGTAMTRDERWHARVLGELVKADPRGVE